MKKQNKNETLIVIGILGFFITNWITKSDSVNITVLIIASYINLLFLFMTIYFFIKEVKSKSFRNTNVTTNNGKKIINLKQNVSNDFKAVHDDNKDDYEDLTEQNEDPIGKLK